MFNVQVVSRLYGITAEGDILGICDEKISYKVLNGYGIMTVFNSRIRPRVNHISQLAGSRTPLAYLDSFVECGEGGLVVIRLARAQFTTERQSVLLPAVAFSKTSFKHR